MDAEGLSLFALITNPQPEKYTEGARLVQPASARSVRILGPMQCRQGWNGVALGAKFHSYFPSLPIKEKHAHSMFLG